MSAKAAALALTELRERFPELRAGVANCRKIAGTSTWSQHAWSAGLDIHHRDYGYSASPAHQAWLDQVFAFINRYRLTMSIRTALWRVNNHYDHIHIDFWPRGYGTPPCAGGTLRVRYSNGLVVSGDPGPEKGSYELPDAPVIPPPPPPSGGYKVEVHRDTIKKDAKGDLVEIAQSLLARAGFPPANSFDANHKPDGIFGAGMDTAVKNFQKAKGLTQDGVVGPKSWSGLESL